MAYEPRRTLLIALSALAVVLAAALFPAAGVGSHPERGSGPAGPGPATTPDIVSTPTDQPTPTGAPSETPTPEPTETPTERPTDTPVPPDDHDDPDEGLLGGLLSALGALSLFGLLKAFALAALGWVVLAVGVVLRGARPGTPYVDLPGGYTITLPFAVPPWLARLPTTLSRTTMGYVVGLSASVARLVDALGAVARGVAGGLAITAGESLRGVGRLLTALPRALSGLLSGVGLALGGLTALPAALTRVGGGLRSTASRPDEDARAGAPEPQPEPAAADGADEPDPGPPTVTEAWAAMVEHAPVSRSPSTTPTEFARAAVDRGLPAGPVVRLTRAFQAVAYGGHPEEAYADRARTALARLREHLGGDRS